MTVIPVVFSFIRTWGVLLVAPRPKRRAGEALPRVLLILKILPLISGTSRLLAWRSHCDLRRDGEDAGGSRREMGSRCPRHKG
ncbi:hypothetical protein F5X68DRAFT_205957, partial [Plectosphaerella plurivora]